MAEAALQGSPAEVAPILDTTADELSARLAVARFTVAQPEESLSDVAAGSGQSGAELMRALMAAS